MNIDKLRSKRILLPSIAVVAVLAVGGTAWTATADNDVEGDERDRVASAATDAAGGGRAIDVETSDDAGEAYEVEVRLADGTEVDLALDEDLQVVSRETDDDGSDDRDDRDDRDDTDADDRVLTAAERASAEEAALAAVGGGTLLDLEASDDPGVAYEAEVLDKDNQEWDVDLDASFTVIDKFADN